MSKKKTNNQKPKAEANVVVLSLPIEGPCDGAYVSNHVQVQLSGRQALAMRMLLDGLHAADATFDGGRYVKGPPDVVRYVLSNVADAAGVPA